MPPGCRISCVWNGIKTAVDSVVSVRRALIFRSPYGSTVFSPSTCCHFSVDIWHRCFLATDRSSSVSESSCFLLSARCTIVRIPNIILWSLVVRSSSISFVSFLCSSISYGTIAEKLLFAFCLLCQLVTFVSTPSRRFWISLTASSVGTGRMSMDNIRFRLKSHSSEIMSSFT